MKPTKIEDPEPTPSPPQPSFGGGGALTSSDVQIKDLNDDNFFGGNNKINNGFNGIKFMGSQIASFGDIPTLNSKIVKPKLPKLPSINKIGGPGGMMSKIFNPAVSLLREKNHQISNILWIKEIR